MIDRATPSDPAAYRKAPTLLVGRVGRQRRFCIVRHEVPGFHDAQTQVLLLVPMILRSKPAAS